MAKYEIRFSYSWTDIIYDWEEEPDYTVTHEEISDPVVVDNISLDEVLELKKRLEGDQEQEYDCIYVDRIPETDTEESTSGYNSREGMILQSYGEAEEEETS